MENLKPISHKSFKNLNKRVTIIGYPPLIGGLLFVVAIFLPVMSLSLKVLELMILAALYLAIFIPFTIKQVKNVKERKLDVFDLLIASNKLKKNYQDNSRILNLIRKEKSNEQL